MAEIASETAGEAADPHGGDSTPKLVVERFLDLLRRNEVEQATQLLAVDVVYENIGLPTVRGRKRVRRLFQAMARPAGAGFEAHLHTISADGPSVLTERTDVLKLGRLRAQFWVCGRFDVRDGEIVLWRDYFDHINVLAATVRGLLGTVLPTVRATPPSAA
ncbi:MAG: limonene-1,2-epoxide hydrolase family protein [Solirubrobacterales bacterium]